MHVISEVDTQSGALLARNPYHMEFGDRVAFFSVDDGTRTASADRSEFIGRNGNLRNPAAMDRVQLSGRTGAALDPCAAMQVAFELAGGEEREIVFTMGAGRDADDARSLIRRLGSAGVARAELEAVWRYWGRTLGAVQVETPDPSVNVLANGWLVYQTLACRLWARSGFYQSGGAFGFRDQLQDVMALLHTEPRLMREHLLRVLRASMQKEMSSIGGIHQLDGACARIVPTISYGCLWLRAVMWRPPEIPGYWMNRSASSKVAQSTPRKTHTMTCPIRQRRWPVFMTIACVLLSGGFSSLENTDCRS